MSVQRPLGVLLLLGALLFALAPTASAGELDACLNSSRGHAFQLGSTDLGLEKLQTELRATEARDLVPMGDLALVEDFHPETDRWTEHNNRIRITVWTGAWLFSNELDIHTDLVVGFRINWEVPGFIGIRWDSGFVPWSRMEVKGIRNGSVSSRFMDGIVHNHTLSLGIFNPELSISGLAFWAGFGAGVWVYDYNESNVFEGTSGGNGLTASFQDVNIGGHIFIELDYEIADIFHVGIGIRQHFILADHTDDGRFYDFDGVQQGTVGGRNDGIIDDLAGVTEITLNLSVLF